MIYLLLLLGPKNEDGLALTVVFPFTPDQVLVKH